MRRCILLLIVSCCSFLGWAQAGSPALKPLTIIKAGSLIDGVSNAVRHDQVITVRGNMIVDVASGG